MFTTVVFDLDGTLLDTLQDLAMSCNHTLSVLGLPVHPIDAYRKMVGNGIPKLMQRMLPEQNRGLSTLALATTIFEKYYALHMNDLTAPYSGIVSMLHELKSHDIQLGVLSNKDDLFMRDIITYHFPPIFDMILGKHADFPPKPDPSSLLYLLDALHATPNSTLYCGDSDVDIFTSHGANIASCGVLWGFRDKEELQAAGADLIVDTPAQLLEYILIKN